MEWITYLLCLSVGLGTFLSYRQGLRDGAALSGQAPLSNFVLPKKHPPGSEEETELMRQYEEMMQYDFDRAGEIHEQP